MSAPAATAAPPAAAAAAVAMALGAADRCKGLCLCLCPWPWGSEKRRQSRVFRRLEARRGFINGQIQGGKVGRGLHFCCLFGPSTFISLGEQEEPFLRMGLGRLAKARLRGHPILCRTRTYTHSIHLSTRPYLRYGMERKPPRLPLASPPEKPGETGMGSERGTGWMQCYASSRCPHGRRRIPGAALRRVLRSRTSPHEP